ncbi:4-hydroxybenzoate polyprenyltransferase, mitochondrial [Hypsizygus marmoreus]|uniref:4-hydroxybenzoate polyprenyltransferase, mitochondrial n=1 Tax=Hypsizygus marmoreus TaxID=39966 RepID=A0A369JM56_HYPMA|nr:4-hydroxybenzoate polyprenyltransferase, mitochondrial [Hypsizygus marmoreus]
MAKRPSNQFVANFPIGTSILYRQIELWIELTRIGKFAGTMVVFWPFAWGLTMAARSISMPLLHFFSYMITGFFGACAGCVWNDILDRSFDAQVARTKYRPVASGKINVFGAAMFLSMHLFLMLSLIWKVNRFAWTIGLLAVFPLTGIYPLMKRVTYWPQAWLGIAINIGITMSWACTTGSCPKSSFVLSGGSFFWTLWYDTIYACQDKKDDVNAGVKSTALLFGNHIKAILAIFGTILISSLLLSGVMNGQSPIYFVLGVIGGAAHLCWQLYTVDIDSPKSCWQMFEANGYYFGAIVEAGLALDYVNALSVQV